MKTREFQEFYSGSLPPYRVSELHPMSTKRRTEREEGYRRRAAVFANGLCGRSILHGAPEDYQWETSSAVQTHHIIRPHEFLSSWLLSAPEYDTWKLRARRRFSLRY